MKVVLGTIGALVGFVIGGIAGYWLEWLRWELVNNRYGTSPDHGFDYGWIYCVLAGAIVGAVGGGWLTIKVGTRT